MSLVRAYSDGSCGPSCLRSCPEIVVVHVARMLDARDLCQLSATSKRYLTTCRSDEVWQRLIDHDFGTKVPQRRRRSTSQGQQRVTRRNVQHVSDEGAVTARTQHLAAIRKAGGGRTQQDGIRPAPSSAAPRCAWENYAELAEQYATAQGEAATEPPPRPGLAHIFIDVCVFLLPSVASPLAALLTLGWGLSQRELCWELVPSFSTAVAVPLCTAALVFAIACTGYIKLLVSGKVLDWLGSREARMPRFLALAAQLFNTEMSLLTCARNSDTYRVMPVWYPLSLSSSTVIAVVRLCVAVAACLAVLAGVVGFAWAPAQPASLVASIGVFILLACVQPSLATSWCVIVNDRSTVSLRHQLLSTAEYIYDDGVVFVYKAVMFGLPLLIEAFSAIWKARGEPTPPPPDATQAFALAAAFKACGRYLSSAVAIAVVPYQFVGSVLYAATDFLVDWDLVIERLVYFAASPYAYATLAACFVVAAVTARTRPRQTIFGLLLWVAPLVAYLQAPRFGRLVGTSYRIVQSVFGTPHVMEEMLIPCEGLPAPGSEFRAAASEFFLAVMMLPVSVCLWFSSLLMPGWPQWLCASEVMPHVYSIFLAPWRMVAHAFRIVVIEVLGLDAYVIELLAIFNAHCMLLLTIVAPGFLAFNRYRPGVLSQENIFATAGGGLAGATFVHVVRQLSNLSRLTSVLLWMQPGPGVFKGVLAPYLLLVLLVSTVDHFHAKTEPRHLLPAHAPVTSRRLLWLLYLCVGTLLAGRILGVDFAWWTSKSAVYWPLATLFIVHAIVAVLACIAFMHQSVHLSNRRGAPSMAMLARRDLMVPPVWTHARPLAEQRLR